MPCPQPRHPQRADAAGHRHEHRHHRGLDRALVLTALFALVELIAGFMADSLALLADAGHMASDIVALGLAALADRIASRPAHAGMSYGYGRIRVLAAQLNGLGLWFVCGWISWEAFARLSAPHLVDGGLVLGVAILGLLVNLISLFLLRDRHDLNTRAAYWHVFGDALGSIAAMLSGLIIVLTGWNMADPLLSLVVAGILAWGGWRLLRETTLLLMESAPESLDVEALHRDIETLAHVDGLHHVHLWTLPDGRLAMSAHVEICDMRRWPEILPGIQQRLAELGVEHATLQPELKPCGD